MRHCYDSSILIGILRDDSKALDLVCSHEDAFEERSTTAISVFELALGCRTIPERNGVAQLLETMDCLELDAKTAFAAGVEQNRLAEFGRKAPLRDLLIAMTAKEKGWTLHTMDKAFPALDDLDLVVH